MMIPIPGSLLVLHMAPSLVVCLTMIHFNQGYHRRGWCIRVLWLLVVVKVSEETPLIILIFNLLLTITLHWWVIYVLYHRRLLRGGYLTKHVSCCLNMFVCK